MLQQATAQVAGELALDVARQPTVGSLPGLAEEVWQVLADYGMKRGVLGPSACVPARGDVSVTR
jgi:hypothetical protein